MADNDTESSWPPFGSLPVPLTWKNTDRHFKKADSMQSDLKTTFLT